MKTSARKPSSSPFIGLRNIGPAAIADLDVVGISSLEQLAASSADDLYVLLQERTARRHDPCVWDVFAAAIHQARTGEARDWWAFTPQRKQRQRVGEFPPVNSGPTQLSPERTST